MKINVCGTKSKLQSSLDFYLKITSLQEYKSLEDMRKKMFNTFMAEENARSDLNELYSMDNGFEEAITTELDIENEGLEIENNISEKDIIQLEKEKLSIETEKKDLDNENIEYVSNGRFLDDVQQEITTKQKGSVIPDSVKFVSHGKYLDDILQEDITIQKRSVVSDANEFVDHGKYLDDLDSSNRIDYVSNGKFVEDFYKEEYEEDTEGGIVEEDLSEEGLIEEELTKEDLTEEELNADYIESEEEQEICNDEILEDYSELFEEDLEDNDGEDFNESEDMEVVLEEPRELTVDSISLKDAEDPNKRVTKEDVLLKPSNIRDFIRQNGRSVEENLALKYYSKKEITDALRKTKIYKKGGKLYI